MGFLPQLTEATPKDLRTFIEEVVERYPDEIKTVDEAVDPRFGVTAVRRVS